MFWLCAQCVRTLADADGLLAAQRISELARQTYDQTIARLDEALVAVNADFRADRYTKVNWG